GQVVVGGGGGGLGDEGVEGLRDRRLLAVHHLQRSLVAARGQAGDVRLEVGGQERIVHAGGLQREAGRVGGRVHVGLPRDRDGLARRAQRGEGVLHADVRE